MSDDFKERLIEFATTAVSRADRVTSEEAAKQYLILPFFHFLGYDPLDPDEIIPEAEASFSEKFRNKVDYAICINGEPVMAVECKKTGELSEKHRGELKGYFNAVTSAKLGILTDGLQYELFSDTNHENMMDSEPFVRINLSAVARGEVSDQVLDAVTKLRKGMFDPADVGTDAKRRIFISRYVRTLDANLTNPSEAFTKVLMDLAEVEGRRTSRLIEEHAAFIKEAIQVFLDRKILERVGFASREDLVKTQLVPQQQLEPEEEPETEEAAGSGIITTETEIKIFDYVKTRLAFLVRDEELYKKLQELYWVDYKTRFAVSYKQERKGRLFNFREGPNGEYRFDFPELSETIETTDLHDIDEPLVASFVNRVKELDET